MAKNLVRYQQSGHLHFITFSCDQRRPYLGSARGRELFEEALEKMRLRYEFSVLGYVVMPEHVHLLVSEPKKAVLATVIQALKLSMSGQSQRRPFWLERYYDFNVFTQRKLTEKLRYMHRNPVKRGLVTGPAEWAWSSFRHYLTGEVGAVEIESNWTVARRGRGAADAQVSEARPGAPGFVAAPALGGCSAADAQVSESRPGAPGRLVQSQVSESRPGAPDSVATRRC